MDWITVGADVVNVLVPIVVYVLMFYAKPAMEQIPDIWVNVVVGLLNMALQFVLELATEPTLNVLAVALLGLLGTALSTLLANIVKNTNKALKGLK